MNQHVTGKRFVLSVTLMLGMLISATTAFSGEGRHKPITEELILLIKEQPEIGSMLEASIAKAREINSDRKTNPAQSLSEYYDYIDRASELLPQQVLERPSESLRDQMLQGICYFYFLVGQPLDELKGKGLYKNSIQYYPPFSTWLRKYADSWGDYLGTEASWNTQVYNRIYNAPEFGLQKGWYESPANWKSFNDFFSKYLKSPDQRPVTAPDDPSIVVFPADSVPQGVWAIDGKSNIHADGGLTVKLATYYSVGDLLGEKSAYRDSFSNGVLTHSFLNVNDYHRYHFAVGGTIKEKAIISENVALEVAWDPGQGKYVPIDSIGWQFTQTRGYVIVDTGKYGLVALIPMGMAHVSSVNFEENVQPGSTLKKGDMLGNFLFGGSDFIMLFQEKAGFAMTVQADDAIIPKSGSDHGRKVTTYKHGLVGEKYGVMNGK